MTALRPCTSSRGVEAASDTGHSFGLPSCQPALEIDPPIPRAMIGGLERLRIGTGMLVVETIARVRREHLVKGKGVRKVSRNLGLSRNTVRRILRSGETSFTYEREAQPHPKLGTYTRPRDMR